MKKPRIYVDTSVIGGCIDPEFSLWSLKLFENFKNGLFLPLTSELVSNEIYQSSNKIVHDKFEELLSYKPEIINVNDDILHIRDNYLKREILNPKHRNDLLHIAIATYSNADLLVSWNFKHIVRFDKIILYNSVNNEMGYKSIHIYSPREVDINEN